MPLPIPNLDRRFAQIAERGRALIPSSAPEWTDHNVHDPGITFLELFSWLAEIQHYRLNRTSAAAYARFFALAGLAPRGRRPAEVAVNFEFKNLGESVLVPANTKLVPVGHDDVPFETLRDTHLAPVRLRQVATHAAGRVVAQTAAQENEAGHFEAFGPSPQAGDELRLGFEGWFTGSQGHLSFAMFEGDLPPAPPLAPDAQGFVPSARVRWEYQTAASEWRELNVIEDGTLHLSRGGDVIFEPPAEPPRFAGDALGEQQSLRWLRAVLAAGRYEIPPRVAHVRTNTVRARQIKTVCDEDLGPGLGTPDQTVRLKNYPVRLEETTHARPFEVGEVLNWEMLALLFARDDILPAERARLVRYVGERLSEEAGAQGTGSFKTESLRDEDKYAMARAFERLLDRPDFYRREVFAGVKVPAEFAEFEEGRECEDAGHTRRFNRYLLQRVFPELFVSDRVEIQTGKLVKRQTGTPAPRLENEARNWTAWERVEDFARSGPDDRHYRLDPETGIIVFGNGLNGRVPASTERIRARFYRHTRGAGGNLTARLQWRLDLDRLDRVIADVRTNAEPAAGGAEPETINEAKSRARAVFRKQFSTLTGGDYETQALSTPGLRVARARAVANFNPRLPKLSLPGEVTVVVLPRPAPRSAFPDAAPPEPTEGFRATVRNHLEARRVVTTNIHVVGPAYVPVAVSGRVFLRKGASADETAEGIRRALAEFLDPVRGGPDRRGWPFGRSVFPSEINQQLARVAGVDYVTGVVLNNLRAGEPVALPYNGLPVAGEHRLTPITFEQRGREAGGEKGACRD